jgi:hypothetical protein
MMNDVLGGDVDGRVERLAESAVRFLGQFGKCVGGRRCPHVSGDKMPSRKNWVRVADQVAYVMSLERIVRRWAGDLQSPCKCLGFYCLLLMTFS